MKPGAAVTSVGSPPDTRYQTNWATTAWDFAGLSSPQTVNTLSYGFGASSDDYPSYGGGGEVTTMVEFTSAQKTCIRLFWAEWSQFTGVAVQEFTGSNVKNAMVRYAKSNLGSGSAYCYEVGTSSFAADVWINSNGSWDNPQPGNGAWYLHIHESGHAVAQKHTHDGSGNPVGDADYKSIIYTVTSYYQSQSDTVPLTFTYAWDHCHGWQMDDYRTQIEYYGKASASSRVSIAFGTDGQITRNGVARQKNSGTSLLYWTLNEVSPVKLDLTAYTSAFDLNLAYEAWSTINSSQLAYIDQGNGVHAPGNFSTGIETQVDQVALNDGSHTVAFNSALTSTVFLPRNQSVYTAVGADRDWVLTRGGEVNTFTAIDFVQFADNLVAAVDLGGGDPTIHVCAGPLNAYNWKQVSGGVRLIDARDGSPDGTVEVTGEAVTVQFSDQTVARSSLTGDRRQVVLAS